MNDPTQAICEAALKFDNVTTGASCNQKSFKAKKSNFLFIGPGAKGVGYKAMFKLDASVEEAKKMAAEEPSRYQIGSTKWATVRFTEEAPVPEKIWRKWLVESYELSN